MSDVKEFNDLNRFMDWAANNIKFNSKYDESYFLDIISSIKILDFVRVKMDEFQNSIVYQFMFVYRNHLNYGNFAGFNVTSYDDGLAYITNGRICVNDSENILQFYPVDTNEINENNIISFKFIRMFYDVQIPHDEFTFNILQIISNQIVNYLTSLGFSCRVNNMDDFVVIFIHTQSESAAASICGYLFNINWEECLESLNGIIASARIISNQNKQIKDIYLSSNVENDLTIKISNDELESKSVVLEISLTNQLIVDLYNGYKTEVYDGWEFLPQLKYVYSNPNWNVEPIYEFKVIGLKQVFPIHDKYLPLMDHNILRVDGFIINGIEYRFYDPQFVAIPFRTLNSAFWNKYVLNQE